MKYPLSREFFMSSFTLLQALVVRHDAQDQCAHHAAARVFVFQNSRFALVKPKRSLHYILYLLHFQVTHFELLSVLNIYLGLILVRASIWTMYAFFGSLLVIVIGVIFAELLYWRNVEELRKSAVIMCAFVMMVMLLTLAVCLAMS